MNCPFCLHPDNKVIDSRAIESGKCIRRRRRCFKCDRRWTTYERLVHRKSYSTEAIMAKVDVLIDTLREAHFNEQYNKSPIRNSNETTENNQPKEQNATNG